MRRSFSRPGLIDQELGEARGRHEGRCEAERLPRDGCVAALICPPDHAGNTLGSEDEPSRVVPDPTAPPPRNRMPGAFGVGAGEDDDEEGGASAPDETVTRVLTFWKDGFSIDDGPLLKYEDHKETLKALNEGRAPLELLNVRFGQRVDVQIANRPQEMYRPPPPKPMKAFGGSGNRLGAPTPELAGSPAASSSETPPVRSTGAAPPPSRTVFEVNPNEPVTQIQIRLGDGQRLVAKFNHTHTVGDIIAYINKCVQQARRLG